MQVQERTTREVATLLPETPVMDVVRILREKAISGAPVVDDGGRLVGIVSHADLLALPLRTEVSGVDPDSADEP